MVSGPAMAPAAWPGGGSAAAATATQDEMRWRQLDSGVSAVSFGFVATAILVSMFLAMAILEHFLRTPARARGMGMGMGPPFAPSPPGGGILFRLRFLLRRSGGEVGFPGSDLEAARKLDGRASPEMPVYSKGVSVLMPGQDVPTFIAHPAPAPCPPGEDPVAIAPAYSICWFLFKSKLAWSDQTLSFTIQSEGIKCGRMTTIRRGGTNGSFRGYIRRLPGGIMEHNS